MDNNSVKPPLSRLLFGGSIFILGFLVPLFIPLVLATNLSPSVKTLISGGLAIGIPELFMLAAIGILGKPGYNYLKEKLYSFFKKHGPPDTVSLVRYRIGLILFIIPVFIGFILPYILDIVPYLKDNLLFIVITGDILFFISLLVLGGDFWDKLRSLFIYKSRAVTITDGSSKIIQHD